MTQTYFLEPLDVLHFRDGRPRVTGDSHVLKGSFPPPPSTLYGAFRSAILAQAGARFDPVNPRAVFASLSPEVAEAVGTPERFGTLVLHRMQLAVSHDESVVPLVPVPRDLVRPKLKERQQERLLLVPVEDGMVRTSLPAGLSRLGVPGETDFVETLSGWLDAAAFGAYLRGEVAGLPLHATADEEHAPYATESRTSVMLDDETGTAADGMLFTTDFTRLRIGYGLYVKLTNAPGLGLRGLIRLGAEQRPVAFRNVDVPPENYTEVLTRIKNRFRLVLTAPAPFSQGWCPDFLGNDFTGTLGACQVRLIAAAVGRYEHIGGWDLVERRPRPAVRAVPAGSVYYFDIVSGDPEGLRAVSGRSLFPPDDERARMGLGVAFIGTL